MRDPIDELSNFDPGPTMTPLPASEVRRRGTRLRRRNTALTAIAAAAAVTVVAVPVAALAGHDSSSTPQPAPPVHSWVQQIPDGFDVTAVPAGSPVRFDARDDSVVDDFTLCGRPAFSTRSDDPVGPATETAGATAGEAGTDGSDGRTLAVYADDTTADRALAALREGVTACPRDTGSTPYLWGAVEAPAVADGSLVISQQVRQSGYTGDLTLTEVVRVGNALLLASTHTDAGGDQAIQETLPALTALSQPVVDQMCVFSATGCSTASNAVDPSPTGEVTTAIAADFPLLDGLPTTAATKDFGRYGPKTDKDPMSFMTCENDVANGFGGAVERLGGGWTDPAEARVRQLSTFASAAGASAYLRQVEEVGTCQPQDTGSGVTEIHSGAGSDLSLGDEAFIEVRWYRHNGNPAPGFQVTELVRVGNAVLAQTRTADGYDDNVTSAYLEQIITESDQSLADVVDSMCVYAEGGC
ncbi:hypothetical protein [Nocardioides mangrovi]|uniref:PknH-like extracellular domain-containing protein n=1 Tax=Nocardioides mangrovi TaxID=2874580 RepID=A0ABS7UGM4_9ACTN|nr:hypothetical protein [Nocardioides mangrovi]MBZ5740186.1 hypothetical protein [Nocardioides mangrovi]